VGRVDDVLVDLVGEDEGVVLLRERRDVEELGAGEDLPRGVRGVAEDDGLRLLREGLLQLLRIEAEIGRAERDVDRLGAAEDRVGGLGSVREFRRAALGQNRPDGAATIREHP